MKIGLFFSGLCSHSSLRRDAKVSHPRGNIAGEEGSALVLTMVIIACALVVLAATMAWSNTSAKQTDRANRYMAATAAAEAATELAVSKISRDYLNGDEALVLASVTNYRSPTLTSAQSPYWADWEFTDTMGHTNSTYVNISSSSNYTVLNSAYAGLKGFVTTCDIVANAHEPKAINDVVGGVYQQLQLARIPIFQRAAYSSGDMEISCGQPFVITGPVHSNGKLYVEPDNALTFLTDVTAVGDILFQRHPLDTRNSPSGSVTYKGRKDSHVSSLTLPIGQTNTPTAVREIIEPPPVGEDPTSLLAKARYFNQVDMVITAGPANITATSGRYNNFATLVTNTEVALFVSTTNSFHDEREKKTVLPIDIDIQVFALWCATNGSIRPLLGNKDVYSLYVLDLRTFASSTMSGVRVFNGDALPSRGLTVATSSPLYVWGNFNSPIPASTNTSTTLPASLVGDALTVLSDGWSDSYSVAHPTSPGTAQSITVNAALLAGAVDTTLGHYSGGMENFPRFLENWGSATFTYNGSMVKMFPSLYATNAWGKPNVYNPPKRNWAYDRNFEDPTKLPPLTPGVLTVGRSIWNTVAANTTNAPPADL
jgi:hypothetical protein